MSNKYTPAQQVIQGSMRSIYEGTVNRTVELTEASIARGHKAEDIRGVIIDTVLSELPYSPQVDKSFLSGAVGTLIEKLYGELDRAPDSPNQEKKEKKQVRREFKQWENDLVKYVDGFRTAYVSKVRDYQDPHAGQHKAYERFKGKKDRRAARIIAQREKVREFEYHWLKGHLRSELPEYEQEIEKVLDTYKGAGHDISQIPWSHFSPILLKIFGNQNIDDPSEREIFLDFIDEREALRDREISEGGLVRKLRLRRLRRGADTWRPGSYAEMKADDMIVSEEPMKRDAIMPPPAKGLEARMDHDTAGVVPQPPPENEGSPKGTVVNSAPSEVSKRASHVATAVEKELSFRVEVRDYRNQSISAIAQHRLNRRQQKRDNVIRLNRKRAVRNLLLATFKDVVLHEVPDSDVKEDVA
jgi:hypothetical protein